MTVHNHGTDQGKGLACPEQLLGECEIIRIRQGERAQVLDEVVSILDRYSREPVVAEAIIRTAATLSRYVDDGLAHKG